VTEGQITPSDRTVTEVTTATKVEAPTMQTYYCNSVDVLTSVYDFTLTIGQMRASSPEAIVIEQQARVIMSPQHMKVLAKLLTEKVAVYEESIAPIPVMPVLPPQLTEA